MLENLNQIIDKTVTTDEIQRDLDLGKKGLIIQTIMAIEQKREWGKIEPCMSANYIYESAGIRVAKDYCEIDGQARMQIKYVLLDANLLCDYFSRNLDLCNTK